MLVCDLSEMIGRDAEYLLVARCGTTCCHYLFLQADIHNAQPADTELHASHVYYYDPLFVDKHCNLCPF
jgi:hypothetical protein